MTVTLEAVQEAVLTTEEWDVEALHHPNCKYDKDTKVALVTKYASSGNLKASAAACGVDYAQARSWKTRSQWWGPTIAKVQKIQQAELDAVMTSVIDKAMTEMTDRIENGDTIRDTKTGELVKIPMKGKELAVAAAVIFDKRSLIRGDATSISGKKINPLKNVQEDMLKWAKQVKEVQGTAAVAAK